MDRWKQKFLNVITGLSKGQTNSKQDFDIYKTDFCCLQTTFAILILKYLTFFWDACFIFPIVSIHENYFRSRSYQTFFLRKQNFFRFLLLSLAIVQYIHFFHTLQTLKLNSKNQKTGKMKVWLDRLQIVVFENETYLLAP